jgi:hypothetical protein
VVRLERHVEDPTRNEQTEDPVHVIRQRYKHREDGEMSNSFRELAVVHGADAWNQAEDRRQ